MSEEEFLKKLGIINNFLHNVEKTLNTTNIPISWLCAHIYEELGIDMNKIGEDK